MNSGVYVVKAWLERNKRFSFYKPGSVKDRKYGKHKFSPGFYLYVGRAMRNLGARIRRHQMDKKAIHWHIDRLLRKADGMMAFMYENYDAKNECRIAGEFMKKYDCVDGFGSSDCKCRSHLFYVSGITEKQLDKVIKRVMDKICHKWK